MREFAAALISLLHDLDLRYAIGGSIASSYYGEPRTTLDIDLSIQLAKSDAATFVAAFAAACEALDWYVSRDEVARAAQAGGSFSVNDGFWKADLFVVGGDTYAVEALTRWRQGQLSLSEQPVWFLAPEDVIIHKLRWCAGELLDKHVRDITAILQMQAGRLDLALITRWAGEVGAGALWAALLDAYRRRSGA